MNTFKLMKENPEPGEKRKQFIMTCFVGLDLALNHFGLTLIRRDGSIKFVYGSNEAKFCRISHFDIDTSCSNCKIPEKQKGEDTDTFNAKRREVLICEILDQLRLAELSKFRNHYYVALEDYAYTTMTSTAYILAEMVGVIKNYLWQHGYNLRTLDPSSLKMWATGNGTAHKKDMVKAAKQLIPISLFSRTDLSKNERRRDSSLDISGPITDIADSALLALFVKQEYAIRNKEIKVADLPVHQRKVFIRSTKNNPIDLLSKPFIRKV
jgi:hypothetical protein